MSACSNCEGEHAVCSGCWVEIDLTGTFTASELKERLETATTVALALGRKEALDEVVGALIAEGATQRAIAIVRSIASQPYGAASNGLTAPSGHSDLPPTPEAGKSRRAGECGICLRDFDQSPGPECGAPYVHDNPTPDLPEGSDQ